MAFPKTLKKALLVARAFGIVASFISGLLTRSVSLRLKRVSHHLSPSSSSSPKPDPRSRNIVVIGASMAGHHAAHTIATSLPPDSPYRVVVVEPHEYFQFTWVLPRFSVVGGHEHKAFIPYGPYLSGAPDGAVRWVRDRVVRVTRDSVQLNSSGEEIAYAYLVVATGAGATDALPSRVGVDGRAEGIEALRQMQGRIRDARNLVVMGGGAAGVELAADAKAKYPEKTVTLVHSRDRVMHRFGRELQDAAMEGLLGLGVEVVTGDRVVGEVIEGGIVRLKTGREIECDFLVNCAGQRPNSQLIAELSPESIARTGHVLVKSTLQIQDESLPNIYVCGDVAETQTANPNSRSAMHQAMVVADNILLALEGRDPTYQYKPLWVEGLIKLTLGLDKSVTHLGDGSTELLFRTKEKDLALMSAQAWKQLGARPFEDDYDTLHKMLAVP